MTRNVADDKRQPVKGSKALGRVTILGGIVDTAALLKVSHPLLRELAADYVMSKALQGISIIRRYRLTDMDVEAAVLRGGEKHELKSRLWQHRRAGKMPEPRSCLEKDAGGQ